MAYSVKIAEYAETFILENVTSERVLRRIEDVAEMLGEYPSAVPQYNPDYAAARPPFPCRFLPLPDTPFTLYYLKDDDAREVIIFDIEWTAGDPRRRFSFVELPS